MQSLNFELIFMKFFKILKIFDESIAVYNSIIHYVDVYFKVFVARKNVRLIRFYVIKFFYWLIVFKISWFIKNNININFEKIIVEIFIAIEQSTFNISIFFEKKNTKQIVNAFKKYEFIFMIFINENDSFIDVNIINVVVFSRLIKKNHNFEIFNLKNIKKIFNIKSKSNSITMI